MRMYLCNHILLDVNILVPTESRKIRPGYCLQDPSCSFDWASLAIAYDLNSPCYHNMKNVRNFDVGMMRVVSLTWDNHLAACSCWGS